MPFKFEYKTLQLNDIYMVYVDDSTIHLWTVIQKLDDLNLLCQCGKSWNIVGTYVRKMVISCV